MFWHLLLSEQREQRGRDGDGDEEPADGQRTVSGGEDENGGGDELDAVAETGDERGG